MAVVNVHEAKTQFSKLVARAAAGERITIARAGTPVAELGPLPRAATTTTPPRRTGMLKGMPFAWDEASWTRQDQQALEDLFLGPGEPCDTSSTPSS